MKDLIIILTMGTLFFNCTDSIPPPSPALEKNDNLTLGTVQSQIQKGMSQTEVLSALGSPNIVTKGSTGNEVWTYDKIGSSQSAAVSSTYGARTLGQGIWVFLFGGVSSRSSANATTESKSLTVIITFDENNNVSIINYQSLKY